MLSSGSSSDLTLPWHQQEGLWHISQVPLCQPQPVQPLMQLPHKTAPGSSASSSAVESPCPASPAHHHHHHLTTCKPELQFPHCSPAILCQDQLWCTSDLPQPGCPGPAVPSVPSSALLSRVSRLRHSPLRAGTDGGRAEGGCSQSGPGAAALVPHRHLVLSARPGTQPPLLPRWALTNTANTLQEDQKNSALGAAQFWWWFSEKNGQEGSN